MTLLIAGVALWAITHLMPAIAPGIRSMLVDKLGVGPFKGLFALDIVVALLLMVFGWKAATPSAIFVPPLVGSFIPVVVLALAVLFFVAAKAPNNLRRYVRHPQMMAVICWGVGHLLANGDSRSLILFGGLAAWAFLEIIFINRRDGERQEPAAVPIQKDIIAVAMSAVVFAGLVYFHASLFGGVPIPT